MACCEVLFGTVPPTTPPSETQIPIYIDRTSKKVYYWNGTGWELIWEIQTAGNGTPGVVSIDPNSPIYIGAGGTLQINCERLKTQCGFATVQEVSEVVTNTINEFIKNLNTTIQAIDKRVTNLSTTVTQLGDDLNDLEDRVTTIEKWDLCAKTKGCGYSTGGGGPVTGVTKLIAGPNITLSPASGTGDVMISAAGGGGGGGPVPGVTKLIAGTNITLSPASGTGEVIINAAGGSGGGGGGTAGVTSISSNSPEIKVSPGTGIGDIILTFLGSNVTGDAQNGFFDIGNIRVQWGTFTCSTGNLDPIPMQYPFGATPYVLLAMERSAGGWTGSGAANPMPTVYGTHKHPTTPATKFLVSCVRVLNAEQAALVGEPTKYEAADGQWFGIGSKP